MESQQAFTEPVTVDPLSTSEVEEINVQPPQQGMTPQKKKFFILGGVLALVLLMVVGALAMGQQNTTAPVTATPTPSPRATSLPSPSPTITPSPSPTASISPKKVVSSPSPKASTVPQTSPSPGVSPSPTPSPVSQDSGAPQFVINYPSENQNVTLQSGSAERICVVETFSSGDRGGLQKKHTVNGESWTSYAGDYQLCFTPKEGQNTFSLQYRNDKGQESPVYTRQFSYQKS